MTPQNCFSYKMSSEGVTILRFYGSETEVVAPATIDGQPVVAIAANAFCNCCQVTKITLGDGLQSVGDGAFKYCSRLKELALPDGLLSVGKNAFVGCFDLKELLFPASLQRLGDNEFPNGLRRVSGSALNGGDNREELALLAGLPDKFSYELREDGVTIIGFWGAGEEVAVPAEIDGCPVVAIGPKAFHGNESLKKILFSAGLQRVGVDAFTNCENLTEVLFSAGLQSVGDNAFASCENLTKVSFPEGLQSIGDNAFASCVNLTKVSLPEGLKSIGNRAFADCESLTKVLLPESLESIGDRAFAGCGLTEIAFPEGMQSVGEDLCASLKKVSIAGFQNVGDDAWNKALQSCRLQEIVLPDSWQSYAGAILMGSYLTLINVSPNNPNIRAIDGVLFSADGKTLLRYPCGREGSYVIPDGVEGVAVSAFKGGWLQELVIPASLQINDADTFRHLSLKKITLSDAWQYDENFLNFARLTEINVSPANPNVSSDDGVLFSADGKTLLKYPCSREELYVVPNGVRHIGDNAFACGCLNSVVFPRGLQSIGNGAFRECGKLWKVSFSEGLQSIGNGAFKNCGELRNVAFLKGLQSIGDEAFSRCTNLISVSLPEGLQSIGSRAFASCYAREVTGSYDYFDYSQCDPDYPSTYPPDYPTIAYTYSYRGLQGIKLPDSLQSIGEYAFAYCRLLKPFKIPENVREIGENLFYECCSENDD